jgi:hypothetical protein
VQRDHAIFKPLPSVAKVLKKARKASNPWNFFDQSENHTWNIRAVTDLEKANGSQPLAGFAGSCHTIPSASNLLR